MINEEYKDIKVNIVASFKYESSEVVGRVIQNQFKIVIEKITLTKNQILILLFQRNREIAIKYWEGRLIKRGGEVVDEELCGYQENLNSKSNFGFLYLTGREVRF